VISAVPSRRWVPVATMFGVAGLAHFLRAAHFDEIVPRALPGSARTWTLASGVVELGLAAGLALPGSARGTISSKCAARKKWARPATPNIVATGTHLRDGTALVTPAILPDVP
jgi:hypothetical protein